MIPPTVVNIRKGAYEVYIGRSIGRGRNAHRIATLYSMRCADWRIRRIHDEAVIRYETLWRSRLASRARKLWLDRLATLDGKRLGCICDLSNCHGDVLVTLFKEFFCNEHKGMCTTATQETQG